MFTRSAVVALTGISESRLKTLIRREQLPPYLSKKNDAELSDPKLAQVIEGPNWNRWAAVEVVGVAVAERLMMEIGYADGLPPVTAAKIVVNNAIAIHEAQERPDTDIWAGYVGHADSKACGGFNVCGSFREIAQKIEQSKSEYRDCETARAFLVNVSAVIRAVKQRAAKNGIDFELEV